MIIAEINSDGVVQSLFNSRKGYTDSTGIKHSPQIFSVWSDAELNAVKTAIFNEVAIAQGKQSTGFTDVFDGKDTMTIMRTPTRSIVAMPIIKLVLLLTHLLLPYGKRMGKALQTTQSVTGFVLYDRQSKLAFQSPHNECHKLHIHAGGCVCTYGDSSHPRRE